MRPDIERAIAERAQTQLGLITHTQLIACGVTPSSLRTLARAALEPIGRHVYRWRAVPPTWEQEVLAVCLDVGGFASHRTAARLHGLGSALHGPSIEVVTDRDVTRHGHPRAVVHSTTNLPPDDLVTVGPVPCIGVARTFLMLASLVPIVPVEAIRTAIGDTAREGKVSDAWLWWRLERLRCRGRGGVTALEEILRRRQKLGPTESWLEHTFLDLLEAAGLPLPEVQRRIARRGSFVARVDCCYPLCDLVIELEGFKKHSTPAQRRADEVRRRRLVLAGQHVMVVTYDELVSDPGGVLADVAEALTAFVAA